MKTLMLLLYNNYKYLSLYKNNNENAYNDGYDSETEEKNHETLGKE